ncbi:MAG: metallophosphatase [Flavobacteriia bacterium]|nr:metallophosphatase [Flavobacteriia bacterium]OJX39292.1 MAG: metallophosphatase [Flavobacteriia bacterium 40-80]
MVNESRRKFIRNTSFVVGALGVKPSFVLAAEDVETLTVLHTNDTHSNIDTFPANHAKYPNQGGVSKRFTMIEDIRRLQKNVLLLDAGDIFQGTPYFNMFGGVLEHKLMSELGYDAATMGNHDFDIGLDGFLKAKQYASFDFICSNYDFLNTVLEGQTVKYKIFQRGKYKIGVFGLGVNFEGLVSKNLYKETRYLDPVETAQEYVRILRREKADLIICLSHLGYEYDSDKISDLKLAAQTEGIHLIIGGHTHTFLEEPAQVLNKKGEITLVNQVGWAGVRLGRIDFQFRHRLKTNCVNKIIV